MAPQCTHPTSPSCLFFFLFLHHWSSSARGRGTRISAHNVLPVATVRRQREINGVGASTSTPASTTSAGHALPSTRHCTAIVHQLQNKSPTERGITAHQRTGGQTNSVVGVTKLRPLTHHPTEHPRLKDCDPFFLSFPYFLVVSPSFSFFLFLFLAEVRPFHGSLLIPFYKLFYFIFIF